ncbi:MAG: HEAT repeat domain-containing protein [Planctomycetota bacterium]
MYPTAGPVRYAGLVFGVLLVGSIAVLAQTTTEGFITGTTAQAWEKWFDAMQAILDRNPERAETAFGELLALEPSPFRVALLADHTVQRTAAGGAVLLFEQDMEANALGPNGQAVAQRLTTGREQMNEADDGFYFCQIGRFDVAQANFRALLDADPDPVAVLEFTDRSPKRRDILLQLTGNPTVGDSARALLRVLDRGEVAIKADPTRIKENIARLGGPPRGYENACEALKASGEYAIPFVVQTLRDPGKQELLRPIVRCLPQIDRPALNPLVMALRMNDDATRQYLTEALAQIGYTQAVPYLLRLQEDPTTSPKGRQDATQALEALAARAAGPLPTSAAEAFLALAEDYYADKPSLAADARLDTANVWYWRDDLLQNVKVPTPIFNEIMCMRCCEEALRLNAGLRPALALWLAANQRREAQLPPGQTDPTRPEDFPPPLYFAQSAGADYCLMTLARAVDSGDPAVALGMVEALHNTAGPASLLADAAGRLPLAEALSFPDRMVRIRAALTLGRGRPVQTFLNHQNLMPVLAEALTLHAGARAALIVDPDAASANAVAGVLRAQGYEVVIEAGLLPGLERVRKDLPAVDVLFIASDVREPELAAGLGMLRSEFRFASAPVVVVSKAGGADLVRALVRADHRLTELPAGAGPSEIGRAVATVSHAVGAKPITPEVGVQLAYEAGAVLRDLALTNNPVFNVADVEPALLTALGSSDVALRVLIAEVLGYLGSSKAQEAIARIALDAAESEDMRLKMFAALTEAAKRRGNLLGDEAVRRIITIVESEPNMTLREAASATLGALNVPGEPASTLIRNQYGG